MADLVGRVGEPVEKVGHGEAQDEAVGWYSEAGVAQDGQNHHRVTAYDDHGHATEDRVVDTAKDNEQCITMMTTYTTLVFDNFSERKLRQIRSLCHPGHNAQCRVVNTLITRITFDSMFVSNHSIRDPRYTKCNTLHMYAL